MKYYTVDLGMHNFIYIHIILYSNQTVCKYYITIIDGGLHNKYYHNAFCLLVIDPVL